MYKLIYITMDHGPWLREWSHDLQDLINLADNEQHRYDSCQIEDDETGRAVWEPSLGMIESRQLSEQEAWAWFEAVEGRPI